MTPSLPFLLLMTGASSMAGDAEETEREVASANGRFLAVLTTEVEAGRVEVFSRTSTGERNSQWSATWGGLGERDTVLVLGDGRGVVRWNPEDREPGWEFVSPTERVSGPLPRAPSCRGDLVWTDGPQGPVQALAWILDGGTHQGEVTPLPPSKPPLPGVDQPLEPDLDTGVPYVDSFRVPALARADVELVVSILGNHPTPGWSIAGFTLEEGTLGEVSIRAHSLPPKHGRLAPQVLAPFEATVRIRGLTPGQYAVRCIGRSEGPAPQKTEILPAGLALRLGLSGGFAGFDERFELFESGVVRVMSRGQGPRFVELDAGEYELSARLIRSLGDPPAQGPPVGADLLNYEFLWCSPSSEGADWHRASLDDRTCKGVWQELANLLTAKRRR